MSDSPGHTAEDGRLVLCAMAFRRYVPLPAGILLPDGESFDRNCWVEVMKWVQTVAGFASGSLCRVRGCVG